MKLEELNPRWVSVSGDRHGMGISFDCPHCKTQRLAVWFVNPVDGGEPGHVVLDDHHAGGPEWQRTGDTFETLTLTPSIDASAFGHWHGFITNGEIV